jgi:hypothetical protein
MPTVINRWHFAPKAKGLGAKPLPTPWLYIGRGTPLGNPFTVANYGSSALELYRRWLWDRLAARDSAVLAEMSRITDAHYLVCSCKPRPCHGDVVVAAWHWLREQERQRT